MANDVFCVNDGKPYFSMSAEHNNEPLCAQCYKAWLENKDALEMQKHLEAAAVIQAKIEAKQKFAAASSERKK